MKIIIRHGNSTDLAQIYNLVLELAKYENEPNAVTTSLDDYQKDYRAGLFNIIVAEQSSTIIGMMLFYFAYSTWKGKMIYLEDFIIADSFRNKGIGQQLMDFLITYSKKENAKLVKWQVLDWNTPAINFYKKNDAIIEDNWWNCKIYT